MPNESQTNSDILTIYAGHHPALPLRIVDLHGHKYHWIHDFRWTATVARGGGSPLNAGKSFDTLEEALNWVQDKPHFQLEQIVIIRAKKVTDAPAQAD